MDDLKKILEINPVMITSMATAFIGVCGALGVKELLSKAYDRYCKKDDEKEVDHKHIQEIAMKIDEIIKRIDDIERKNDEFTLNDMLMFEDRIISIQTKAIKYKCVTRECVPRYHSLIRRYRKLSEMTNSPINTEIEFNDTLIQNLINDGNVIDSWKNQG